MHRCGCLLCENTEQKRQWASVSLQYVLCEIRCESMMRAEEHTIEESYGTQCTVTLAARGRCYAKLQSAAQSPLRPNRTQDSIDRIGQVPIEHVLKLCMTKNGK